jgi:hypothetical protein
MRKVLHFLFVTSLPPQGSKKDHCSEDTTDAINQRLNFFT